MHIVFVDWKIIKGQENAFKDHWKVALPIQDRSRMVGEFLSEPTGHEHFPWITWDLRSQDGVTRFINVGLWADAQAFDDQAGKYFNPSNGILPFEFELRRRALLTPRCWRMGAWELPVHDSGGVL